MECDLCRGICYLEVGDDGQDYRISAVLRDVSRDLPMPSPGRMYHGNIYW